MKNYQSPKQSAIKLFLSILFAAVLLNNMSFCQNGGSTQLSANATSLSFNAIAAGGSQTRPLVLANSGRRRLIIRSVQASPAAFKVSTPTLPLELAAAASTNLSVTFVPATSGTFQGSLVIIYRRPSGGGSRSLTISLAGTATGSGGTPAAVLQSIAVSPTSGTIAVGSKQPFTATGHYSDSSTQNLTASATWTSSNTSEASVSAGVATGVAAGTVTITASQGGVSSSGVSLTVTAAPVASVTLKSVMVSPLSASISVGQSRQFTATGTYSDGSSKALTSGVSWISSNPADATISTAGLATAVTEGSSNVTAALSGVTSTPAAVLTVTAAPTAGGGTAFYVSPTGNDSNTGSISSPWKTIQHAANTVQAGDTVYVRAGTYAESVNIGVSGSAGAGPVTFQNYPGETAIIDGTGLTPSASDVQGLFNITNQSYVTIQGFEIRNYTTSNANSTPAGIWVTGAGSHVQLLNNIVHNITTTSEKNGNAFGIAVYGSSSSPIDSITISGNQVYSLKTGNSETLNVDGNVTNFTISNNLIHDNDNIGIDAIGFEGVAPSASVDFARNGEISGNTVYNITAINNPGEGNQYDADGIYVDGGSQIVVEGNTVYNCDLNIEAASEHSGHLSSYITIRNNLVYKANSVGISIGGYASNVGGSDHITIVNNTLFENDTKSTGSGELQVQYYATNNIFENNIVYATSQALFINNYTNSEPNPVSADYNLYFSSVNSASADFLWNGTDHTGFSGYQSASGQDEHSTYADPDFLSLTTPNLQVGTASPALGKGINLGATIEGSVDFAGNPRVTGSSIDIGAYQQ